MIVYLAIVKGIYRHAVLHASFGPGECEAAGRAFVEAEHDHYHDVEIVSIPVDSPGDERLEATIVACFDELASPCFGAARRGIFTGTERCPA